MDENVFYSTALFIILSLILFLNWLEQRNLPPGPWGLPFLGYAPFMGKLPFRTFMQLSFRYGPILRVRFGRRDVVVLNDYNCVQEAFVRKGDMFNHRGEGTIMRTAQKGKGIVDSEGPLWKEHRRFTLKVLRDFGFGKRSIEDVIMQETNELLENIESHRKQAFILNHDLSRTIVNVIWSLVSGRRFEREDPKLEELLDVIDANRKLTGQAGILTRLPWLRFVLPIGNRRIKANQAKRARFFQNELDAHKKEIGPDSEALDLIHSYLRESQRQIDTQGNTTFTDDQTRTVMSDLFIAGMETVAATLRWAFLLMIKHPEIQDKVQNEIDEVIGNNRAPNFEDRVKLPFTEATLLEIQRFGSVIPFVLHANPEETELGGYRIPKRTWIFGNLWAVHHNPESWHKPDVFNPYRFLDESGMIKKADALMPFSVGRRSCLGESLAKMELFLVFTSVLQKFNLVAPIGANLDPEPIIGITHAPGQYPMIALLR